MKEGVVLLWMFVAIDVFGFWWFLLVPEQRPATERVALIFLIAACICAGLALHLSEEE